MNSIESLITGILEENGKLNAEEVFEKNAEYSFKTISKYLRNMAKQGELDKDARRIGRASTATIYYSIKREAK
ncbi:MAG: hypothetical protein V1839_01475 [archaeon]